MFYLQEAEVFEVMLGRLMNAGMLSQARELAALFEHDSADLILVLVSQLFTGFREKKYFNFFC